MPDATSRLSLPVIAPSQAQKHVTHNEALIVLDALVQLSVLDVLSTAPPTPAEGDRFLVGAGATGAFAGHVDHIAALQDGAWLFFAPVQGWIVWNAAEDVALVFDGVAWVDLKPRRADRFGIAMDADGTNRLSVASEAFLLTHDGDDCRIKVNKAIAGDTASLLFQTDFSGRAEIGLAGDDKFHVKISPDGSVWSEIWVADPATGQVGMGTGVPTARLQLQGATLPQAQLKCRTEATSALLGGGIVLHHNNAAGALPVANDRLGYVLFGATDGSTSRQGGGIAVYADGNYSSSSLPTRFAFETAPVGSASRQARLTIGSDGNVGVGVTVPAARLDVDGPVKVKSYTVAGLPAATTGAGAVVFVSNESSGAVLAFSDGTDWRRVTDRAVVS